MILKVFRNGKVYCVLEGIVDCRRQDDLHIVNFACRDGSRGIYYAEPGDLVVVKKEEEDE